MRVENIAPEGKGDPNDETLIEGSIDCPKCGIAWMQMSDGIEDETTCRHLRFAIVPGATSPEEIYYFNGMTAERLVGAVVRAYQRASPEAAEDLNPEEAFQEALFDRAFWPAAVMDEIDVLFDHTEYGMACGPVKNTVLFGAKLDE